MAYCKNCGTKLDDGAKFCPKCGTPTDYPSSHDDEYDEQPKKSGCGSTAIAIIAVFFVIGFFYNKCGGDDSEKQQSELVNQETDTNENSGLSKKDIEIAEEGYKNGYEQGFGAIDWDIEHFDDNDYKDFARNSYILFHKSPSSPEEKKLYDLYEQNYLRGVKDGIMAQGGTENSSGEFLEKGHTYETSRYDVDGYNCKIGYQYELALYNDGTVELTQICTYPNHEYEDTKHVFECTIKKKDESKRDVRKQWYQIEGKCGNEVMKMFVDMEGRVYSNYGKTDFDAVGDENCFQTTFKKIK